MKKAMLQKIRSTAYIKLNEKYVLFIKHQINEIYKGGHRILLQKLWSFLKLIPTLSFSVLCLPIILIVRLIRPFVLIRFGCLYSIRIGHYAAATELYLCEREAGLHPKNTFDVFFNKSFICNYQLKKMWERTLFVSRMVRYLNVANYLLPGYKNHSFLLERDADIQGLFEKMQVHLSFTSEEEEKGYEELNKMGITQGEKFVCFNARDSAYLNTTPLRPHHGDLDWSHYDYRDSNIHTFIDAAEELTRRGYFAIRMGAVVKEKLNIINPRIIDYANKFRTDFMDIYLPAKCKFFISTGTGIDDVATVFRKPKVYVNFISLEVAPSWVAKSLVIFKKLWLRKENRSMTFREILESGVGRFMKSELYHQNDIEVVDNTPEEITAVVIEMDERLKGTWLTTEEDEELQQRFWALFKKSELHGVIRARIGRDFLRQNQDLLN